MDDRWVDVFLKTMDLMKQMDRIGAPYEADMACICALFDHVNERHGRDKKEALKMMNEMVTGINDALGDMYQKPENVKNISRYGLKPEED